MAARLITTYVLFLLFVFICIVAGIQTPPLIGAHSRELRYMHVSLGGFYLSAEKIIKQTRSSFNLEELDEDDDETDKEKV